MTAREMHYDFKQKLNKLDSQKERNLKVPEIDWKLNEAQEVYVKMVAQPWLAKEIGFEFNQRSIDSIRTIVVNQKFADGIVLSHFDGNSFLAKLPDNYWFYVNSEVYATKGGCVNKKLPFVREVQHDDDVESSPFDKSDFQWGTVNIRFFKEGIRVFSDGTFTPTKMVLNYLVEPKLIHNAQDWTGGQYRTIGGQLLTGTQACELPKTVHGEIVDLAVFITANDINLSSYNFKRDKLGITK